MDKASHEKEVEGSTQNNQGYFHVQHRKVSLLEHNMQN